jgi:hypothetical protein
MSIKNLAEQNLYKEDPPASLPMTISFIGNFLMQATPEPATHDKIIYKNTHSHQHWQKLNASLHNIVLDQMCSQRR